ncbi:MAG: ZIP family metal transporter [Bacteroidota bacterium]
MDKFIIYFFLIITVLASGYSLILFKVENKRLLKLLLAFSGAFLLAISFLNLVPEIYKSQDKTNINIGLYVLLGFVLQLFLELLTKGVEHGHSHSHTHEHEHEHKHEEVLHVAPLGLMIGICIHSFLEGMPIVEKFDPAVQHSLAIGIVIHNIPISFVLMSLFLASGMSKTKSFLLLGIFALMTPLGSILSNFLSQSFINSTTIYFDVIMGVVVGIFLHVSTSILYETSEDHQYNRQKFFTVIIGIIIALLVPLH